MEVLFLESKRPRGELYGRPGPSHAEALTAPPEYGEIGPAGQQALDLVCAGEATLCGIRHGETVLIAQYRPSEVEWRGLRPGFSLFRLRACDPPAPPRRRGGTLILILTVAVLASALAWGQLPPLEIPVPPAKVAETKSVATNSPIVIPAPSDELEKHRAEIRRLEAKNQELKKAIEQYTRLIASASEASAAAVKANEQLAAALKALAVLNK